MPAPLKVKISTPFPSWPTTNQLPSGRSLLDGVEFIVDQDDPDCDFWIIFDDLAKPEQVTCASENILFVTGEPPSIKTYSKKFLAQFATVLTCHLRLPHHHVIHGQQGHPWHVGKTYDEVVGNLAQPKSKLLSIITSNKIFTAGHRARYDFAHRLKKEFGDQVELFGRGVQTFDSKWEVLAPFKYTVAIENYVLKDWITEKLPDCWLAESYPLYYGAPNVHEYYPRESLTPIDIHRPAEAIRDIRALLENAAHYDSALPAIREAKRRYLQRYSFFPLLSSQARTLYSPSAKKQLVTLQPASSFQDGWLARQQSIWKIRLAARHS